MDKFKGGDKVTFIADSSDAESLNKGGGAVITHNQIIAHEPATEPESEINNYLKTMPEDITRDVAVKFLSGFAKAIIKELRK